MFNIELAWKFTHLLTPSLMCSKPYGGQVSAKIHGLVLTDSYTI